MTPGPVAPGRRRVVVIGGGISGLAAARALVDAQGAVGAGAPVEVTVVEAAPVVGGKLRLGRVGDLELDLGAESLLARRPEGVRLLDSLGLAGQRCAPATASAWLVRDGRRHPVPPGTVLGVPSDPASLAGVLTPAEVARAGAEPVPPGPPADGADRHVAAWVGDRLGRAVVDHLVEPLLGGVYAGRPELLSARATLPGLWAAVAAGRGLVDAAREQVAAGRAAAAEGRSGGMGAGPGAAVFAGLDGGLGRLPLLLAAELERRSVTVLTGSRATGLVRERGGWRVELRTAAGPRQLSADAVVVAVEPGPAGRLLAPVAPGAAAALAGIETASVALVAAVLPAAALAGIPGSGMLVPAVAGRAVKAVTFASAKWDWVRRLDPGAAVVRMSLGRHREAALLDREDDDLVALAAAELAELIGRPVRPRAARVVRWDDALPQYGVGHLERVAAIRAAVAAVPGLAICGAALDGVGIPACLAAAQAAAERAAASLSRSGTEVADDGPGDPGAPGPVDGGE